MTSEKLLSLYVPKKLQGKNLISRLQKIADKEDRSVNWIICHALMEYVQNYGKRKG